MRRMLIRSIGGILRKRCEATLKPNYTFSHPKCAKLANILSKKNTHSVCVFNEKWCNLYKIIYPYNIKLC